MKIKNEDHPLVQYMKHENKKLIVQYMKCENKYMKYENKNYNLYKKVPQENSVHFHY